MDPEKLVALVLTDHQGCSQQSDEEADLMAALACRLICGHNFPPDLMAIITPPGSEQRNPQTARKDDLRHGLDCE